LLWLWNGPAPLRQVVADLGDALAHEIGELHLHHGLHALDAEAERRAQDRALAQGCVAHAPFPEPLHEAFRDLERTAVFGDVLAHEHQVRMPFHALGKPLLDGVDHARFATTGIRFQRQWRPCRLSCIGPGVHIALLHLLHGHRIRLLEGMLQVLLDTVLQARADAVARSDAQDALPQQPLLVVGNGIFSTPFLK